MGRLRLIWGLRMREPLRVAVAQPLCVPYDVGQNAVAHAAAVRAAAARVVVFPELSLTGDRAGGTRAHGPGPAADPARRGVC